MNFERHELRDYDTFVTNDGSLDERIQRATGLADNETLVEHIEAKPRRVAIDIMVPNRCSENCMDCYFRESGAQIDVTFNRQTMGELRSMARNLGGENKDIFFLYPREITTAMPMLELYSEYAQDRVLSNGKLLHLPGVLDKIIQAGVKRIYITCPGSRETYMEYTNEPAENYDQLLENIRLAVDCGLATSVYMPIYQRNIDEVVSNVLMLGELGVKNVDFIRMKPMGFGQELSGRQFVYQDEIIRFLGNLNQARHLTNGEMHLALFRGSWGVNFYNESVYRYLSGQDNTYPKSRYFCPMIDEQYFGVMMGSNRIYGCFQGVSFEEFEIGKYYESGVKIDRHMPTKEWLHQNLRGMCSAQNCPEHDLCMGGCRVNAYSWAKQRGESNPMAAGQDFCITNFLRNIGR